MVKEIENDFPQRHGVSNLYPIFTQILHALQCPSAGLTQFHNHADIVLRCKHCRVDHGLQNLGDFSRRELTRVSDLDFCAVIEFHVVDHRRRCSNELESKFPLKALAHNFEVQQPQKTTSETEAQCDRSFGFIDQCRVGKFQLIQRFTQVRIVTAIEGVEPREDHRFGFGISGQRLGGSVFQPRHRVTHFGLANILHAGNQITHFTHTQTLGGSWFRRAHPNFQQFVMCFCRHHFDALFRLQRTIDHAHIRDDTAVGVIDRIKNQSASRCISIALRRRNEVDDLIQELPHTDA